MITCKNMQGRLGNNLFQIAATVSLALDNNDTYGFSSSWPYKNDFPLANCFYDSFPPGPEWREPSFAYTPIPYQPNLDIVAYVQSYKYFDHNRGVIQGLLTPKNGVGLKSGTTSIHCRYTDYVNNPAYVNLGMDYYNQAMEIIKSSKYLIFSDDISKAKRMFVGPQFEFSEGRSVIDDLKLGLACENNIISNSSFAYWGAYLNKNPNKIVVAPAHYRWFGPALAHHDTTDLCLLDWLRV